MTPPSHTLAQEVGAEPATFTGYVWMDLLLVGGLILAVFVLVWFAKRR